MNLNITFNKDAKKKVIGWLSQVGSRSKAKEPTELFLSAPLRLSRQLLSD